MTATRARQRARIVLACDNDNLDGLCERLSDDTVEISLRNSVACAPLSHPIAAAMALAAANIATRPHDWNEAE